MPSKPRNTKWAVHRHESIRQLNDQMLEYYERGFNIHQIFSDFDGGTVVIYRDATKPKTSRAQALILLTITTYSFGAWHHNWWAAAFLTTGILLAQQLMNEIFGER